MICSPANAQEVDFSKEVEIGPTFDGNLDSRRISWYQCLTDQAGSRLIYMTIVDLGKVLSVVIAWKVFKSLPGKF
jgi:hypothetical protein